MDFHPTAPSLASVSAEAPDTIVTHWDTHVALWDLDVASWQQRACSLADRNRSEQEWKEYLGDVPYENTCPGVSGVGIVAATPITD